MMEFIIPFDCCVSKRDKIIQRGNRIVLTERYKNAKRDAHMHALSQAMAEGWKPIPSHKAVEIDFFIWFPSGLQKDPINYTENLLDALEGVAYENDRQCTRVGVMLVGYDKMHPRIEIEVRKSAIPLPVPPSKQKRK